MYGLARVLIDNKGARADLVSLLAQGEGSRFTPKEKKIPIIRNLIQENSPLLKLAAERQKESETLITKGI